MPKIYWDTKIDFPKAWLVDVLTITAVLSQKHALFHIEHNNKFPKSMVFGCLTITEVLSQKHDIGTQKQISQKHG